MASLDESVRKLFKGGGILLVGLVLQLGISFFGKLIIARELSIPDYGSVALGSTVAMTGAIIAQLGLHEGIGRYLPRYDDKAERRGVLISALSIAIPAALVVGMVLFVSAPILAMTVFDSPQVTPVFRVFALAIPLMVTHRLAVSTIQGQQRTVPRVVIENIAKPVARILAIGVIILVGASALRISLAYLFGWLVPASLGIVYFFRETNLSDRTVGVVTRRRELLSFSLPLVISGMLTFVFSDLDTLLLALFSGGTEQVALYNVVYPLAMLLTTAMTAFSFLFMPVISELHANDNIPGINRMYQVVTKWVLVTTLPVFLIMMTFPSQLISLTFGAKYADGGLVLQVLTIGFFVHTIAGMNRETTASIGRSRLLLYVDAGSALLNTVLNLALIPTYGPLGAALATTVTYVALNGALTALLYRDIGVIPITTSILQPVVTGAAAFLAVYILAGWLADPTIPVLLVAFAVFIILYGVSVLRFGGVDSEEVMLVKSIEERFGVDLEPVKSIGRRLMGDGADQTDDK